MGDIIIDAGRIKNGRRICKHSQVNMMVGFLPPYYYISLQMMWFECLDG
jgi:hypothetical protein